MKNLSNYYNRHLSNPEARNKWQWALLMGLLVFSACSTGSQSKISGNLKYLDKNQTVAILPVEVTENDQKETAAMFRRSLYANLVQARFNVQERYIVDSLLSQAGLTDPAQYRAAGITRLGELLGADAIVFSKINKVERTYLVIHSSINVGISTEMVDTRTGEVLWQGEESSSDFSGIAKIPTGIFSAITAPVYFITNKLNLRKMTSEMTEKLTAAIRKPDSEKNQKTEMTANLSKPLTQTPTNNSTPPVLAEVKPAKPSQTEGKVVRTKLSKTKPKEDKPASLIAYTETAEKSKNVFYTLQVGAFQSKAYAENMLRSLASKGYNTFLSLLENGNSTLYKVQVERFDNVERAQMFSKELESREHIHALTLKIYTN